MRICILVLLFFYTGILSAEHSIDTAFYDPNGNMKTDQYRSTVLNYDRANQPISITKYILSPSSSTTYHFGYGIADNRIFKGTMSQAYYYLGSHGIYDINADKWEHYPGGVLRLKNNEIHKIVKDHLSNTRAIVGDNGSCIGLTTAYDYYPFGKVLRKHENPVSRYQSTDHETDAETGYNDRGARQYDDESFNFNQLDPHSDKYPTLSPYSYAARNPIIVVDKNGKDINIFTAFGFVNSQSLDLVYKNNVMPRNVLNAFNDYTNTNFGQGQFMDFMKADGKRYFNNLVALQDGKYSKYDISIVIYNLTDATPMERGSVTGGRNGVFDVNEINGKLTFSLHIDAIDGNNNPKNREYLGEKIGHEMALHGGEYEKIIGIYEKGGINAVDKYMGSDPNGDKDHKELLNSNSRHEGLKKYRSVQKDLEKMNENYKDAFKEAQDDYNQQYKK